MIFGFSPILAGATLRDRVIACVGAGVGIVVAGMTGAWAFDPQVAMLIVAPIGASAVLVFAVRHCAPPPPPPPRPGTPARNDRRPG